MKNLKWIISALMLFSAPLAGQAQEAAPAASTTVTATFTVYGNCGMCKRTIEKAAKSVAGVKSASWDADAAKATVVFDSAKTTLEAVKKAIAASGYDTDTVRATDEAYQALHGCCQYDRPKN